MGRLKIAFPYLLFLAMSAGVYWSSVRGGDDRAQAGNVEDGRSADSASSDADGGRLIDPVCKMDVNAAWGFAFEYERVTFHFCTQRCRDDFAADPDSFIGQRCLICEKPVDSQTGLPATYLDKVFYLCSEVHRSEFKADPAGFFMHRMWGIPNWLYYSSIAAVLLISFLMFEGAALFRRRRARADGEGARPTALVADAARDRIDLMRFGLFRGLARSRPFRFAVQFVVAAFFLLIIAAGLFGNQNPGLNIAPVLTWTVWWGGLVVLIMFAGKAWCYMCPWDAIAGWMERLNLWKKRGEGAGLNLRWPRVVQNIGIATFLFVGLTWVELGFGVTMRPAATAWIAIAMLLMAIVSAFLFERRSFCRYGCLVGRISGLYAMFSGVEVRRRRDEVCQNCRTKECVKGSATAYGCPTFEYPGGMELNTYCIQCTECLQACPHDNLAVNLRPWGEDLKVAGKPRRDEAYLALLMLALTGFHGLTMTPVWGSMTATLETWLPLGRVASFSLGMCALMAFPLLIYTFLVGVSYAITAGYSTTRRARRPDATVGEAPAASYFDYFVRYAYCVLPIALFYHLAHNLEHLLMEGQKVLSMLSDPFGWGWNLFGTAGWVVPPLVSLDVLWILQVVLVGTGHVYSLWAANKISRRLFADRAAAARGQWPMLIGMIAFSVFSLWLLRQPMDMRVSAM